MKVEHELVKGIDSVFENEDASIGFCDDEFSSYFKFGSRNTVVFLIADRKPRHDESFKLVKGATATVWRFANSAADPAEDNSPWPFQFDVYLNEKFDTSKPVWIWVEY